MCLAKINMEKLEEHLRRLVEQACGNPPGSQQRQKLMTQIIRLTTSKLWRESTPYYQDAVQQTWLYFCRNLCEGITGQVYNADYGSVVTWLNTYLKHRLQDFYRKQQDEAAKTVAAKSFQSASGDIKETIDPVDNLAANPDIPPILEDLRQWALADTDGELCQIHIQGHQEVNCQVLILKRIPPEVSWKELAEEYNLKVSTLSSFYQRQCIPRLRKFAENEGYV